MPILSRLLLGGHLGWSRLKRRRSEDERNPEPRSSSTENESYSYFFPLISSSERTQRRRTMNTNHIRTGSMTASDHLKSDIDELVPNLVAFRRDLHKHPE